MQMQSPQQQQQLLDSLVLLRLLFQRVSVLCPVLMAVTTTNHGVIWKTLVGNTVRSARNLQGLEPKVKQSARVTHLVSTSMRSTCPLVSVFHVK